MSNKKPFNDSIKKENSKEHQPQKNKDSDKNLPQKSSDNRSSGKLETIYIDKEKVLKDILERIWKDCIKDKAC
jgi:hypothetical protein